MNQDKTMWRSSAENYWGQKNDACVTGTNLTSKSPVSWHQKHHFISSALLLFGVNSIYLYVKQMSEKVEKKIKASLWRTATCKYSLSLMIEAK